MSTRFVPCRCGASIPADWPECGECQVLWNTLQIEQHELGFRHHAIRQLQAKGALGPDPLPGEMVHTVSRAIDKKSQEHAWLTYRAARRQAMHEAVVRRNLEFQRLEERR